MRLAWSLIWVFSTSPAAASQLPSPYEIVSIEGGRLTADGRPVRKGYFVPYGAKLRLTSEGRAVLRAGEAGVLMMKGPAELRFRAGKRPGAVLKMGGLLSVLPYLKKGGFFVHTRSVVAAVRGTEFYVDSRGEGEVYLCVCDGTLDVYDPDAQEGRFKTMVATASGERHKAHRFRLAQRHLLQTDAEMTGHSEEEIAALKALLPKPPR